jgi:hypothetical protein
VLWIGSIVRWATMLLIAAAALLSMFLSAISERAGESASRWGGRPLPPHATLAVALTLQGCRTE